MERLTTVVFLLPCALIFIRCSSSLPNATCMPNNSSWINMSHPSQSNNMYDIEQLNSTVLDNLCPPASGGKVVAQCKDDKTEPFTAAKNSSDFYASCDGVLGLRCHPVDNTRHRCPDFAIMYVCKCPPTSSPRTHASGVTSINPVADRGYRTPVRSSTHDPAHSPSHSRSGRTTRSPTDDRSGSTALLSCHFITFSMTALHVVYR